MDFTLRDFVEKYDDCFNLQSVDAHLKESVIQECFAGLREPTVFPLDCMRCARILSRDEASLSLLCADDSVDCLFAYAFGKDWENRQPLTIEALKAISNIIFKRSVVINRLRNLGILSKLVGRLEQNCSSINFSEVLLLDLKVLFLISCLDQCVRVDVAAKGQSIIHSLTLLLESFRDVNLSSENVTYISEVLKTGYNVAYAIQRSEPPPEIDQHVFIRITTILRDLLTVPCASNSVKIQLQRHIVHLLNVLPSHSFLELMSPTKGPGTKVSSSISAVAELVVFLEQQLDLTDKHSSPINELLCPILNLLSRASQTSREIRKYCRNKVLPNLAEDVKRLPEEGTTLRNRLCKHLSSPFHDVSESVAIFLFVLCKENIGRAIKYTGFGNFSGFLARHALLGHPSRAADRATGSLGESGADAAPGYSSTSSDSETEVYESLKDNVNPVTGRWELAQPNPMDRMTDEQKEHLAMELVNKIDRLQREGIIQPGTVEGGRVRPVEHVTELLNDVKLNNQDTAASDRDSDT